MPIERAIGIRRPARRDCGNWYLVADADAIFEALETELQTERAAHERTRVELDQARDTNRKLNRQNQAFLHKKIKDSHARRWLPYWRACRRWIGDLEREKKELEAELESLRAELAAVKGEK